MRPSLCAGWEPRYPDPGAGPGSGLLSKQQVGRPERRSWAGPHLGCWLAQLRWPDFPGSPAPEAWTRALTVQERADMGENVAYMGFFLLGTSANAARHLPINTPQPSPRTSVPDTEKPTGR